LFKRCDLIPTHNLKSILKNIRNFLAANNTGQTLDTEFVPQIINIIFCKIYDERFTKKNNIVEFRAGIDESNDLISTRIKGIFDNVKKKYPDVFEKSDSISLSNDSIAYIVGELQQYCLIESERDVIADAFETFIGPSLRGSQGQFFTPRNVVKLLLHLIDPSTNDKIIDPACGSGGFLVETLKYLWNKIEIECNELGWPIEEITAEKQEIAIKNFRGIDKENFLSKTTKAYMAILGDGRGGIYCENSLVDPKQWSLDARNSIKNEDFSVVLTNPPYGSKLKIADPNILSNYDLGHKWKAQKNSTVLTKTDKLLDSQTPQVLFIERCLELLKPDGKLGIVAPESMFCNPSHKYIMNFVEQHARIDVIVSMPEDLFQPHTHAKTCVAILTKYGDVCKKDEDHSIFMAVAKWCGHDSRGLEIPYDDLPLIEERYNRYLSHDELKYDHLGFTIKKSQIKNSIYLPIYYNPELTENINSLSESYDLVKVRDLIDAGVISITTGDEVGKLAYGTGKIPFIRTSDIANWDIKIDPKQGLSEEIYNMYKESQDVQAYDILMVRDGTYLVGTCAMVSENDTKIVFQSHLYKIRSHDHNLMNPWLLLALLSSPIVKQQIRSKQFTQDIIDTLGSRVEELILPIPKDEMKKKEIIDKVKTVFTKRNEARELMRDTLLKITPHHDFEDDGAFMTLI